MAFFPELNSVEPGDIVYLRCDVVVPNFGVFTQGHELVVVSIELAGEGSEPAMIRVHDGFTNHTLEMHKCDLMETRRHLSPRARELRMVMGD